VGSYDATVIAVCASKGGVGKTTTAVHLATGLAKLRRRRTFLVDLDPQGHVGRCLSAVMPARPGALADLLTSKDRRDLHEVAIGTEVPDLHLTAPDTGLADADQALTTRIGREHVLRRSLRTSRTHYEYVILDCPPNLGNLTINALVAADLIIVPCDPSPLALQGVQDLLAAVDVIDDRLGTRPGLLGVLRTRVDRRNKRVHEAVDEVLSRTYGTTLFNTEIGTNTALAQAQFDGRPVFDSHPGSTGARDYAALVDEVLERVEGASPSLN
jgi:chromosome partitioning protein